MWVRFVAALGGASLILGALVMCDSSAFAQAHDGEDETSVQERSESPELVHASTFATAVASALQLPGGTAHEVAELLAREHRAVPVLVAATVSPDVDTPELYLLYEVSLFERCVGMSSNDQTEVSPEQRCRSRRGISSHVARVRAGSDEEPVEVLGIHRLGFRGRYSLEPQVFPRAVGIVGTPGNDDFRVWVLTFESVVDIAELRGVPIQARRAFQNDEWAELTLYSAQFKPGEEFRAWTLGLINFFSDWSNYLGVERVRARVRRRGRVLVFTAPENPVRRILYDESRGTYEEHEQW